jgi:hypothetical protein
MKLINNYLLASNVFCFLVYFVAFIPELSFNFHSIKYFFSYLLLFCFGYLAITVAASKYSYLLNKKYYCILVTCFLIPASALEVLMLIDINHPKIIFVYLLTFALRLAFLSLFFISSFIGYKHKNG